MFHLANIQTWFLLICNLPAGEKKTCSKSFWQRNFDHPSNQNAQTWMNTSQSLLGDQLINTITQCHTCSPSKKKNHRIFSPLTEQKSDQRWIAWIQTNAHLLCVRTFFVFKMYVKAQQQQNSNLWVFLILEFSEVHFCMELKYG